MNSPSNSFSSARCDSPLEHQDLHGRLVVAHGGERLRADHDERRRRVDAIGSNAGHCLWTGIVPADQAPYANGARHPSNKASRPTQRNSCTSSDSLASRQRATVPGIRMNSSGTISGPHRKTRPVRATLAQRAMGRIVAGLKRADLAQQQCAEFMRIYRLYRKANGRRHSARIAYGCAFQGLPF